MREPHYEDGQQVRMKGTGEIVTIDQWSIGRGPGKITRYTYTVVGHAGTFYFQNEFEPL